MDATTRSKDAPRVVVDTNILVGSAYAPRSASRRVVNACLAGELKLLLSSDLLREYDYILDRAVRRPGFEATWQRLRDLAERVEPAETPRVVPEDADDDKLLAVALAGHAGAVITNDRHLLCLDPYEGVRIQRPAEFLHETRLETPASR